MWHRQLAVFLFSSTLLCAAKVVPYSGALGGIATLSGDAGAQTAGQGLAVSAYAPRNGGAVNLFAGAHLNNYFSIQGNFIWNRNSLRLSSTSSSGTFYQQDRGSSQAAGVVDLLVYFRPLNSRIRPYLSEGVGVSHLLSRSVNVVTSGGSPQLPPASFSSTGPVLRSSVGIDLRLNRKLAFRYSFSELLGRNPISKQLSPPGTSVLKNFHNLFGFVVRF